MASNATGHLDLRVNWDVVWCHGLGRVPAGADTEFDHARSDDPWSEVIGEVVTSALAAASSVTKQIDGIENRIYSSMFDVDDATWTSIVEPVLAQLRSVPDPDRPLLRRNRHPLLVWTVTPGVRPPV